MTPDQLRQYVTGHYSDLARVVSSLLGDPQAATDVLHEKILSLLEDPARVEAVDPAHPDGYFIVLLRRAVVDRWRADARRKRKRGCFREDVEDPAPPATEAVEAGDLPQQCRAVVRAAADALTARERLAFRLFWGADGDRQAALAGLGLSGGRGERLDDYDGCLCRARKKLRARLGPHRDLLGRCEYSFLRQLFDEAFGVDRPGAAPE